MVYLRGLGHVMKLCLYRCVSLLQCSKQGHLQVTHRWICAAVLDFNLVSLVSETHNPHPVMCLCVSRFWQKLHRLSKKNKTKENKTINQFGFTTMKKNQRWNQNESANRATDVSIDWLSLKQQFSPCDNLEAKWWVLYISVINIHDFMRRVPQGWKRFLSSLMFHFKTIKKCFIYILL